jgi:tripartite-type tricarboxylate transporter receptor subunit TctC
MGQALGQTVFTELKPGAGGNIGAEFVTKSAPDGYTLLFASLSLSTSVSFAKLNFDPRSELKPIAGIATLPSLLLVSGKSNIKNFDDLINEAKKSNVNFGSAGPTTGSHLFGELIKSKSKTDMAHIPYKGGAAAMLDLMAGQVPMMFVNFDSAVPHVKSGKMRAIAVTSLTRRQALPDVPTVAESGFPGFEAESWTAISGPPNMPAALVLRINEILIRIAQMPDVREKFAALGLEASLLKPDAMKQFVKQEVDNWGKAVRASGATVD